jgi:cytochrome c-type biogenesis protein CcmH/NrfF
MVTAFSFSVMEPDKDSVKALIQWLVSHQIKKKATFKISDQEMDAKSRDIVLEQVCLESYNESISEYGAQISLSLVGQKVTIDGVAVDQTSQR